MGGKQKAARLIKLAKAVRSFAAGILIIAFYQHLLVKGIEEQVIGMIQVSAYIGTLAVSRILNSSKMGNKKVALIASLIMLITAVCVCELGSVYLLVLAGITGIMPVIGHQIELFSNMEEVYIARKAQTQYQLKIHSQQAKQKVISKYQLVGTVFKIMGCLFCLVFYYKSVPNSLQNDQNSHLNLMRVYSALCGLHLIIYWFVDAKQLQLGAQDNSELAKKQNQYNVRGGLLGYLTFSLFLGVQIMNFTTFSFFIQQKYPITFQSLVLFIAGMLMIRFIAKEVGKKLILVYGYVKTTLILSLLFSLPLIWNGLSFGLQNIQITIFILNFIGTELLLTAYYNIKSQMICKVDEQKGCFLSANCKNIGVIISLMISSLFLGYPNSNLIYSVPIILAAVFQAKSAIILFFFMCCMISQPTKNQPPEQIRTQNQFKIQQGERLHAQQIE